MQDQTESSLVKSVSRRCCRVASISLAQKSSAYVSHLHTPWSRVLLEKLTGSAASQEIPRIFGTQRFLTVPTSTRHLSLSWANSIQSPQPPPTSLRSILILSSQLRLSLPNGLFPSVSPPEPCAQLSLPHTRHMPRPSYSSRFYHPHNIG